MLHQGMEIKQNKVSVLLKHTSLYAYFNLYRPNFS